MAPGHMIPLVDMARQFARHSAKATIIMTHLNATIFSKTIERDRQLGLNIDICLIKFPFPEAGLPENCENLASTTSPEMSDKFYAATELFQQPLKKLLEENNPDCLVADFFFPWATEVAGKLGIPRLVFHGIGIFPICVYHNLAVHEPYKAVESDSDIFIVPNLPHTIKLTRRQLPDHSREGTKNHLTDIIRKALKADTTSYGVVVNSFHELEPAYSDHYRKVIGRKAWHVGPVSLCNRLEDKANRGRKESGGEHECLSWLNSKKPNSVIYKNDKKDNEEEEWLPKGFEERIGQKGFIVRGWAPQVLILDHEAVGGFVTHCGWNSLLKGLTAGVPMVTWPLFAEQFYNEKLITDVLEIGVGVGAQQWSSWTEEYKASVNRTDIEKAVTQLMAGEEVVEMRSRARRLREMAKKAVDEGGSSYIGLSSLLEELRLNRP
ncbi:hypothetical protein LguiA_027373 [Lonicera macranthoides]